MKREEARELVMKIKRALTGHPPPDPREVLKEVREIIDPPKKRMVRVGRDRQDRGGLDREE